MTDRQKQYLLWLLLVVGWWLAAYFGVRLPAPPPPLLDVPAQGWVENPAAVAEVVDRLAFKTFGDTPAGKVPTADLPKQVYLWQNYKKITGQNPPSKNQGQVGSCVSFGTNTAVERTYASHIALKNDQEFKFFVEEVTYGGSRVEVGGGRLRGDGSVGAWAADWVKKWGMVARQQYPSQDLTTYSESLARKYGSSGVPDDIERVAREHPVQDVTLIRDWNQAKTALASGYAIAVCSNQGFSSQRDQNGVCRASGSWAHCMALDGYHIDADGTEYGHIENSWGTGYHKGPVGWGDPPPSGFWAVSGTINSMLRAGDSWAFASVKGWPARNNEFDWYVRLPVSDVPHATVKEVFFALAP